jgi:O-antigen/teichoic acid export membrane protein
VVIALVLGTAYVPATAVAQVALLGAVPFAFCAPLGATMQAVGRASEVAAIGSGSAIAGVAAAFVGAYLDGAMGAVLACGITYLGKFAILSVRGYQVAAQHGIERAAHR